MLFKGVIKTALEGIKPSWRKLFLNELKDEMTKAFRLLNARLIKLGVTEELVEENGLGEYLRPDPLDIFNAFKYCEVTDVKCIIVGQDPYPAAASAHGLSFSVKPGEKIPKSLLKIYECLINHGHMKEVPKTGNLTKWATQGVLLLNRYLTRNPNIVNDGGTSYVKNDGGSDDGNLHPFWSGFTSGIIKHLANLAEKENRYLALLLWGNKAQEITGSIANIIMREAVDLQLWGHPSPVSTVNMKPNPKNFVNCDHFTHVNDELVARKQNPIDWNPDFSKEKVETADEQMTPSEDKPKAKILVFTDGGCLNNGQKKAKASYGVYFADQTFQKDPISGLVPRNALHTDLSETDKPVQPSNNRGELLAIIYALQTIIDKWDAAKVRPVLLVTDSEYCLHTINERIWKWVKKCDDFSDRPNSDMLQILYNQLNDLSKKYLVKKQKLLQPAAATHYLKKTPMNLEWGGLTILHQNSHLTGSAVPTSGFAKVLYDGNAKVDALCTEALSLNFTPKKDPDLNSLEIPDEDNSEPSDSFIGVPNTSGPPVKAKKPASSVKKAVSEPKSKPVTSSTSFVGTKKQRHQW